VKKNCAGMSAFGYPCAVRGFSSDRPGHWLAGLGAEVLTNLWSTLGLS